MNHPEPSDKLIYKFETPRFKSLPGQLTDDGELTLANSFGILDSNGNFNINKFAFHNAMWFVTCPFDCGITIKNALIGINDKSIYEEVNKNYFKWVQDANITVDSAMYFPNIYSNIIVKNAAEKNYHSLSNGFIMKRSTISFLCMKFVKDEKVGLNQDHIKDLSSFEALNKLECSFTHSNPLAHDISVVYSLLITRLIYLKIHYENLSHKEIISNALTYLKGYVDELVKRELNFFYEQFKTGIISPGSESFTNFKSKFDYLNDLIYQINEGKSRKITFSDINSTKLMGYVGNAMFLVFFYLHRLKNGDLKSFSVFNIIKEICSFGGDTDTNACICASVLGILFGPLNLIQRDLLDIMLNCNVNYFRIEEHKRPVVYSPGFSLFFIYGFYKMRERDFERKCDLLINKTPEPVTAALFSLILTVENLDDIEFDI